MNKWSVLGVAEIPNEGGELKLSQRAQEFSIRLSGVRGELMNSRVHGSEEALAELGCALLARTENAKVLVGGLERIYRALTSQGTLAVWSAGPDPMFLTRLKKAKFRVTAHTVRARPGKGSRHTIFMAQKSPAFPSGAT